MGNRRNRMHRAIVLKLARNEFMPEVRIVFETALEEEAYAKEIELIAYWRGLGIKLANLADGGGKNSGWKHSEERRKAIGDSKRGNTYRLGAVLSEETKQKIGKAHTGKKLSAEHTAKMALASTGEKNGFFGKSHTLETRTKVSEANRRRIWSRESRAKLSASLKERPPQKRTKKWSHGPEARANYRIAAIRRWEKRRAQSATCNS